MKKLFLASAVTVAMSFGAFAKSDINTTGFTLTFSDEFNGTSVSVSTKTSKAPATWYFWPPYGASGAYSRSIWDAASFSARGGIMSDKAFLDGASPPRWHSGNLSSMDPTCAGFAQQYGYFEIRAKMPDSKTGTWPAFWLNSKGGIPACANRKPSEEIDVLEWYGTSHDNIPGKMQQASHNWAPTDHTLPELYSPATPVPGVQPWAGFHIYGVMVKPDFITWYIDGTQTNRIVTPTSHMNSPFYVMIDYALGGGWPLSGVVNNSHLDVDWVRVYSVP